jgi:predicted MFS family arabinose efflux permease
VIVRAPRVEPSPPAAPTARATLALALAPALAWLDRGAAAAVVEALRADLWLTDLQLGLVASAPAILLALAAPAYAALAADARRPRLVAGGVLLWSASTFLAVTARGHATLLAARAAAGIGLAAAVSLAPGFLEDAGAARGRGRRLAAPLGCAAGYALAGVVSARFGWRAGLGAAGVLGVVLAAACARVREAPPGEAARAWGALRSGAFSSAAGRVLERPGAAPALAGLTSYAFGAAALASWLPAFLERVRAVPRRFAALESGVVLLMAGVAGALAGAALVDALRARGRRIELRAASGATLGAALLVVGAIFARRPSAYLAALVLALLLLSAAAAPVLTALARVATGPDRAAALGLAALAVYGVGGAPAAAIVGAISDARSLWWAMFAIPVALALASGAFAVAARRAGPGERG